MKKRVTQPPFVIGEPVNLSRFNPRNNRIEKVRKTIRKKDGVIESVEKIEVQDVVEVEAEQSLDGVGYLLFAINDAAEKFGVSLKECLVLLYLKNIVGFTLALETNKGVIRLGDYEKMGYIERATTKKKVYQLSGFGKDIVSFIHEKISAPEEYLQHHKGVSSKGADVAVSKVLGSMFD